MERKESPLPPPRPALQAEASSAPPLPPPRPAAPVVVADGMLTLPLSSIIAHIPKELQGKTSPSSVAGLTFSISLEKVREQLSRGAVKVSFGELRHAVPAGVFANNTKQDDQLIPLPFGEIFTHLPANAFGRRTNQKRTEAVTDIPDIFGTKGEPLAQVRVMQKDEMPRQAAPARAATPVAAKVAAPPPPMAAPAAKIAPSGLSPLPKPAAVPARPTAAAPAPAPQKAVPSAAKVPPAQKPKQPAAPPVPAHGDESILAISLSSISEKWPDPVRAEIEQLGLSRSICEFPIAESSAALKRGKVQLHWKQIRSRLKPAVADSKPSPHGDTLLDVPLHILAPAFLEQSRETGSARKVSVARDIPDLFSKAVKAAAPAPAAVAELSPSATADAPSEESAFSPEAIPLAEPVAALALPIALVWESWPDTVRKEIELCNLTDAKLEIPFEVIEEGLKQGRLSFRWKQVCLWMSPAPPSALASASLGTQMDYRLDLPLNFVAPLYLRHRSSPAGKNASALADIPDVFSAGGKTKEPAVTAEPSPAISSPGPSPVAEPERSAAAKGLKKAGGNLAELFGEPDKRNWTPNDIVHKTATLPGVAGALIALQDGLLVASCMPPNWKTETIAAFLPQIFGRMSQYTKELKMGDLQSVTFAVDQGTFQVFNAGIIYFAVLGQPEASLPVQDLNLIAKEIGRHTK